MRRVHCVRCGKSINEGEEAIRHRHFTGFYCSYKCLALEAGIAEMSTVTNELVEEDKEASGFGWDEE